MNSGKLFTTKEDVKAFDSALNLGGIEVRQEVFTPICNVSLCERHRDLTAEGTELAQFKRMFP